MCGRFAQAQAPSVLAELFDLTDLPPLPGRYNVSPGQGAVVFRYQESRKPGFSSLRWGLVPFWAKKKSGFKPLINARAETVPERPSFRSSFKHGRCLIPVDGFYEWAPGEKRKHPYYFLRSDGRPLFLAGLTEEGDMDHPATFAVLTTESNQLMRKVHDRMPLILEEESLDIWLDCSEKTLSEATGLLGQKIPEILRGYEVEDYVNHPSHEGERCILPLPGGMVLSI